jgi:NAD(P)-dependent dehydrogenase (short-subunit alcohol dehydrogenase family)
VSQPRLPAVQPYHPATFLERGVAVPFTTPLLAGTRARPSEKGGLELVIPNPSGGRGVYILGWNSITSLCCPTLHDKILNERIAPLKHVTPATIRLVAREISAEGLAGEEAMEAASAADRHDRGDRLVANYLLLLNLIRQVSGVNPETENMMDHVEVQRRAQLTVSTIAPRLNRSTNWVASALESIADAMAGVGINVSSTSSRLSRLVDLLRGCSADIATWSSAQQSDDQAAYCEMMCAVADFTLDLAEATLDRARALTIDVVALLRSWSNDPQITLQLAGRAEWLLDGWETICLIWRMAEDDAARRAALFEMAQLIPTLPREVRDWSDLFLETDITLRLRRLVPLNEDWRTGTAVFSLIARNEKMRAATC